MYDDILAFLGRSRSSLWPALRKRLIEEHPFCAVCGGQDFLEVHHKKPFHLWPELELDPDNCCVLCDAPGLNCHLRVGHLRSWSSYNPLIDRLLALYAHRPTGRDDVLWENPLPVRS